MYREVVSNYHYLFGQTNLYWYCWELSDYVRIPSLDVLNEILEDDDYYHGIFRWTFY